MNETIFDIKEPLPISIVIIPSDRTIKMLNGTIDTIIPDVKLYLSSNSTSKIEDLRDIPINTKGISVLSDNNEHFLFTNFIGVFVITTSNLFVTGYINGIKLEHISNN